MSPLTPCEWPGIVVKRGSKGAAVKVVQGWLNTLSDKGAGYNHLEVDGVFGEKTAAEVENYQRIHKLDDRGVVDGVTWRAICSSVRSVS